MKKWLFVCLVCWVSISSKAQDVQLNNVLIVAQMDKPDDRYTIETSLVEILNGLGIKATPSLNVLKIGSTMDVLTQDSIQKLVAAKGITTYFLINVRGFDKRFKRSTTKDDLKTALLTSHLFPIYRDEAISVSFEVLIYKDGQLLSTSVIKCGNISSREGVVKRFRKKFTRYASKHWL